MKKSLLALAVSLLAANGAFASVATSTAAGGVTSNFTGGVNFADSLLNGNAVTNGGSELLFGAWTTTASYALDLGVRWDAFYDGEVADGTTWNLAGYNLTGPLQWNVNGYSNRYAYTSPSTSNRSRLGVLTTVVSEQDSATDFSNGNLGSAITNIDAFFKTLNGTDTATATNNAYIVNDNTSVQYVGKDSYADRAGSQWLFSTSGVDGSTLMLQFIGLDAAGNTRTPVTLGSFTLSGTTLTYNNAPEVPVPAAVWLLGSALVGLGGVARRRNRA